MRKAILLITATLLIAGSACALEFTGDFHWYKMTGTENFKLSYKDTYSVSKHTGAMIRMDQLNDKGEVIQINQINTRRNLIWFLYPLDKRGVRYGFTGEPMLVVPDGWERSPEVKYIRDEKCAGVPCKVYLWTSGSSKFFKVAYYYWISKDNIVVKQTDDKLGRVFMQMNNLKAYQNGALSDSLFLVPDEYDVVKIQ
jgi:hypothetical protein